MKNIAVLTYSFIFESINDIISGITKYFDSKEDFRVFVTQIRSPYNTEGKYGYQYWNLTNLLKAEDIDGFIVLAGSFGDYIKRTIKDINVNNRPVVSISQDLGIENSRYTICKPEKVYSEVISHLKNKHGCSKIGYFSARNARSEESFRRYDAFFSAMEANNLKVDEDIIFDGYYTQESVHEIFNEKIRRKEDVKFDAVLCANDAMAAGAITCLQNIGLKVPEDVKVIGFDNGFLTKVSKPSLSSIDQQMIYQGEKAASLICDMLEGKNIPRENEIELKPVFRQSCGCGNNNIDENNEEIDLLEQYNNTVENNNRISYLFDCVNSKTTLGQYAENLQDLKKLTCFDTISIFLFKDPVNSFYGEELCLPDECLLSMEINEDNDLFYNIDNNFFDVKKQIFPKEMNEHKAGNYFIYPIFSCEELFGYMICRYSDYKYSFYDVCLKLLSHTVSRAKSYTESVTENVNLTLNNYSLEEKNMDLHYESRIDELTQVLNRRGIMEEGQNLINRSLSNNKNGIVFFGDLDGLKTINDTYGHENGDIAIKTEAEILKNTFRETDVVGRLSGDEFAIIAPGFTEEDGGMIQAVINEATEKIVKEKNITFPLSISVGYICFNKENSDLKKLLAQADKGLYVMKHQKHGEEYFKRKNR